MHKPSLNAKAWKRRLARRLLSNGRFDQADHFCRGLGVEIGARANAYPFTHASVLYADIGDQASVCQTMQDYETKPRRYWGRKVVQTDVVLQPPRFELPPMLHGNLDFVFTDNVIEHVTNPIAAFESQSKCLKVGGVIYAVVPNKRYTFDKHRQLTDVEALILKYRNGLFSISEAEANEIAIHEARCKGRILSPSEQAERSLDIRQNPDGSPHLSVFDEKNIMALVNFITTHLGLELIYFSAPIGQPIHICLRKTS